MMTGTGISYEAAPPARGTNVTIRLPVASHFCSQIQRRTKETDR